MWKQKQLKNNCFHIPGFKYITVFTIASEVQESTNIYVVAGLDINKCFFNCECKQKQSSIFYLPVSTPTFNVFADETETNMYLRFSL